MIWFEVQLSFVSLTDRHALWSCLQSTVTPILASMLEVMDRYANLDLLSDDRLSQGLIKLWLDILADSQTLDLTPLPNPRYCGLRLLCNSHSEYNEQKASVFFLLLSEFLVSQTRRCLCRTTSCWMVKNNPVLPHSVGSSECTLKACGKNQNLCQVCLGLIELNVKTHKQIMKYVWYGVVSYCFFLTVITDPQWQERMAQRGFSSLWAPSTTAGWAVTYRNSQMRRDRCMVTNICKTFCCFLWRSSQRTSWGYNHYVSHI